MKEKITIVKVGGKIVEDDVSLDVLLNGFTAIGGHKLLVHGGGRTATDVAARMGVETVMVGGRRVTDAAMLRVVTMVYGGLVNKQVVARLQARGVDALGLTGADMDVVRSRRRPVADVDYGFVGDVERVDADRLAMLVRSGVTPVMAPLTHDGRGCLLNTNADTIAGEVARARGRHRGRRHAAQARKLPGSRRGRGGPRGHHTGRCAGPRPGHGNCGLNGCTL